MSDKNVLIVQTVSVKQLQSIVAVLLKREHIILGADATSALAVREHVTCDDPISLPKEESYLTFKLLVCAPCAVIEEQSSRVVVLRRSGIDVC